MRGRIRRPLRRQGPQREWTSRRPIPLGVPAFAGTTTDGFTLVELLVSLFIFGMLSAAGVALLSFSVRAQEAADARLGDLADFRRAGALARRRSRPGGAAAGAGLGRRRPAGLRGARRRAGRAGARLRPARLGESRRYARAPRFSGSNIGSPRGGSSAGSIRGSTAPRPCRRRRSPKAFAGSASATATARAHWRERWDPTRATELPRAVELVMDAEGSGTTRQLFQTGTTS